MVERAFRGSMFLYTLETGGGVRLLSLMPSHHQFEIGREIGVRIAPRHLGVFESARR